MIETETEHVGMIVDAIWEGKGGGDGVSRGRMGDRRAVLIRFRVGSEQAFPEGERAGFGSGIDERGACDG